MDNFMTTAEAAAFLHKTSSFICKLCLEGKLKGAERLGQKMWIIPEQSVKEYVPGPKGFAAVKARRLAQEDALRKEIANTIATMKS